MGGRGKLGLDPFSTGRWSLLLRGSHHAEPVDEGLACGLEFMLFLFS